MDKGLKRLIYFVVVLFVIMVIVVMTVLLTNKKGISYENEISSEKNIKMQK